MKLTYRTELDHKKLKNGTQSLYIRISNGKNHKRVHTGLYIEKKYYNQNAKADNWIRSSLKDSNTLNKVISQKLIELKQKELKLTSETPDFSLNDYINYLTPKPTNVGLSLTTLITRVSDEYLKNEQFSSANKSKVVLIKLQSFAGRDELLITGLSTKFLGDFSNYLKESGNHTNTIYTNLKTLRTIINKAVDEGLIEYPDNPFIRFKLKTTETKREALTVDEFNRLKNVDLTKDERLNNARHCFLLAVYLGGIRIGDLLQLQKDDIKAGRISYRMSKTGKLRTLLLTDEALRVIKYFNGQNNNSNYLLPYLYFDIEPTAHQLKKAVSAKTASINKALKYVAFHAEIEKNLTTHIARHTFATIAKEKNVDVYAISKLLGHSSVTITEQYLKSLDQSYSDNVIRKLFS